MKELIPKGIDGRVFAACLAVFLIGFLPMPYGFYNLTRVVFFGALIWFGLSALKYDSKYYVTLHGLFAAGLVVLYNPVWPIHLGSKVIWVFINIFTLWLLKVMMELKEQNEANL